MADNCQTQEDLNYGKNYKYTHGYESNFVNQEFLPEEVKTTKLYEPGNNPRENELRKYLKTLWRDKYEY